MNAGELLAFLRLLREVGCLDKYWKNRIDVVIRSLGGQP
jgi:hypothetical protein